MSALDFFHSKDMELGSWIRAADSVVLICTECEMPFSVPYTAIEANGDVAPAYYCPNCENTVQAHLLEWQD